MGSGDRGTVSWAVVTVYGHSVYGDNVSIFLLATKDKASESAGKSSRRRGHPSADSRRG